MKTFPKIQSFIINNIAANSPRKVRHKIYKLCGLNTYSHRIMGGCYFLGNNITIGKNIFINYRCFFDSEHQSIEIGENVNIAFGVMFCTSTHKIGHMLNRAGETVGLPIKVGNGCWIGAGAVILPGVTIGEGCIIAAGAVVNKECLPNGLYAGVPAKRMKELG
ncbi:acyltransferase [Paenibacillus hamazuiensis]|uniref:acyltransferase n=1 Tax=Paenibacillus hamazuiensis TaxID=2936508 RepID=UPI00200DB4A2|nr:DapH/DapD/GlmU-related protein [Paenibacillus hamazuiensis]